jgi:predicted nucleic acid-binding protein
VETFTVIYDACVLYPACLRDLLVRLAMTGLFRARWTEQIHDEWIGNLLKNRPDLSPDRLDRTRRKMNQYVRDSLVIRYEALIDTITLPDLKDRHVLAAAIRANASVIVTYNLSDFPAETLEKYGVEAQHPDEFLSDLLSLDPWAFCHAVRMQRESLKNPPQSAEELLEAFEIQRLPRLVAHLKGMIRLI